jgi:hypothetical protein
MGYKLQIATDFCAKPKLRNFSYDTDFSDSLFLRQARLCENFCATIFPTTADFYDKHDCAKYIRRQARLCDSFLCESERGAAPRTTVWKKYDGLG